MRALLVAVATCLAASALPPLPLWASLAARALLLVGYWGVLWHAGVLSAQDRLAISQVISARGRLLLALRQRPQPGPVAK